MRLVQPARHALHRVTQTRRAFDNPWQVMASTVRGRVNPGRDVHFEVRGATIVAPARRGALFPVYEIFAEDTYRLDWFIPRDATNWTFLDIGAHVGSFAIDVATRFPGATCWAYEASPSTATYLSRSVQDSALDQRVHVYAEALSSDGSTVTLTDAGDCSPLNSTTIRAGERTVEVPSVTLDAAIARIPGHADVVKIDAEGIEYAIVLESAPELWDQVRRVVLENHDVPGHDAQELIDHLQARGLMLLDHAFTYGNPREGIMWFSRDPLSPPAELT